MEFWFCSIKVITVIGLILVGIIITAGGGPNHETIGFRFWNETGGFVQDSGIRKILQKWLCISRNVDIKAAGAKGRFLGFFSGIYPHQLARLSLCS